MPDSTFLGLAGAIVAALASAVGLLWRQTSDLRKAHVDEMRARIDDAKAFTVQLLKVQEVVIVTVNESKVSDAKVAAEISENTKATRELTQRLMGEPVQRPRPGSRP